MPEIGLAAGPIRIAGVPDPEKRSQGAGLPGAAMKKGRQTLSSCRPSCHNYRLPSFLGPFYGDWRACLQLRQVSQHSRDRTLLPARFRKKNLSPQSSDETRMPSGVVPATCPINARC